MKCQRRLTAPTRRAHATCCPLISAFWDLSEQPTIVPLPLRFPEFQISPLTRLTVGAYLDPMAYVLSGFSSTLNLSRISPNLDHSFDFCRTYPLTNIWDPPFNVSLFMILGVVLTMQLYLLNPETPKPNWYPTAIFLQPFRNFFLFLFRIPRNREFETLDSKITASSTSRTPKC
jgi:hypothetical protein